MALRAQHIAAFSVALDVLRSSSVLRTFFRSKNIHPTPSRSRVASTPTAFGQMRLPWQRSGGRQHRLLASDRAGIQLIAMRRPIAPGYLLYWSVTLIPVSCDTFCLAEWSATIFCLCGLFYFVQDMLLVHAAPPCNSAACVTPRARSAASFSRNRRGWRHGSWRACSTTGGIRAAARPQGSMKRRCKPMTQIHADRRRDGQRLVGTSLRQDGGPDTICVHPRESAFICVQILSGSHNSSRKKRRTALPDPPPYTLSCRRTTCLTPLGCR